jgi:mono/diheme cytochrome c family protein
MNETLFFVFGIGLTVAALVVTAIGLRWERFPGSKALMALVVVIFAAGVGGTAVFGWANAEDEQEHREQELAEDTEANEAEGNEAEAGEEGGDLSEPPDTALVDAGATVFEAQGCGGCHTFVPADSTGTTGPALDSSLQGATPEFIREQIVDPNSDIEQGFPPDVMPSFADLPAEDLDGLVAFLQQGTEATTGGDASGGEN